MGLHGLLPGQLYLDDDDDDDDNNNNNFLWLYSPILGFGRLHETFRFISVTRSKTVGGTTWTGDQLVVK
jgi:hypothetical protein